MKRKRSMALILIAFALLIASCSGGGSSSPPPYPARISIAGLPANNGIFDAAPTEDGSGRLWMSYSIVQSYSTQTPLPLISTRVAFSDSAGRQWQDAGIITSAQTVTLPPPYDAFPAAWTHEVSRLVYDPYDIIPAQRWKVLWHRYLSYYDGFQTQRLFEHGWIGLKTAQSPTGPWSAERKLFTGSTYTTNDDWIISAPEFPLDKIYTAGTTTNLSGCLVFTEPGVLPAPDGLYISLFCATGSPGTGKTVLLKCDRTFSFCSLPGILVSNSTASAFNASYNGYSGSELVSKGSDTYLIVTPTENDLYRGCLVFRISDLATASLQGTGGVPELVLGVSGSAGSFNGACGYTPGSTGSGIFYGEYFPGQPPEFRLFGSGKNL